MHFIIKKYQISQIISTDIHNYFIISIFKIEKYEIEKLSLIISQSIIKNKNKKIFKLSCCYASLSFRFQQNLLYKNQKLKNIQINKQKNKQINKQLNKKLISKYKNKLIKKQKIIKEIK
ncbi:hypothetical protein TTHERM_001194634 (macronuclear) [Tetrahymena thermophila SB210]|uniref:Uncharacterized protein n=1 Tax=Tetrahymena thermophila (strain SB210) TaxID=312017 RepID=W7X484_TETTS|nr:hypothetical protein TTHERM_001194634 [Tetrahymena thermophila SB210]EWS74125.1 hypothetical protein TTHERM_001194634 [Tetrahymena thermophila SB210]|eukprot:XP_012653337.1 hypothetical protein TTHERM_001194634 [Tetrahymena thermophila SB210]